MARTSAPYKGGITGALKVAHLAESFGMRAQTHGMGRANAHICAAIPNNDYDEQLEGLRKQKERAVVDGFIAARPRQRA